MIVNHVVKRIGLLSVGIDGFRATVNMCSFSGENCDCESEQLQPCESAPPECTPPILLDG